MSNKRTPPIPPVLTVTEACDLLTDRTGESWTLAQLLHVCPVPSVWIDYDPEAPAEIFGDRWEGLCAPMIFANDVHRLLHADDVALTMTRTPDDRLIRIAGMRFPMDSLRFDRDDVLAAVRDFGASIDSLEPPTSQDSATVTSPARAPGYRPPQGCNLVTKERLIECYQLKPENQWLDRLGHLNGDGRAYKDAARVRRVPGRTPTLFDPALFGVLLLEARELRNPVQLRARMESKTTGLPEWLDELDRLLFERGHGEGEM